MKEPIKLYLTYTFKEILQFFLEHEEIHKKGIYGRYNSKKSRQELANKINNLNISINHPSISKERPTIIPKTPKGLWCKDICIKINSKNILITIFTIENKIWLCLREVN